MLLSLTVTIVVMRFCSVDIQRRRALTATFEEVQKFKNAKSVGAACTHLESYDNTKVSRHNEYTWASAQEPPRFRNRQAVGVVLMAYDRITPKGRGMSS